MYVNFYTLLVLSSMIFNGETIYFGNFMSTIIIYTYYGYFLKNGGSYYRGQFLFVLIGTVESYICLWNYGNSTIS